MTQQPKLKEGWFQRQVNLARVEAAARPYYFAKEGQPCTPKEVYDLLGRVNLLVHAEEAQAELVAAMKQILKKHKYKYTGPVKVKRS